MLYSSAEKFADQKALEAGLHSGALKTLVVKSADEEARAEGWTDDLASLIKRVYEEESAEIALPVKRGPGRPRGS